jgi:hypothetical protein
VLVGGFRQGTSDSKYNVSVIVSGPSSRCLNDHDWMMLGRDLATVVDDYMIAADLGIDAQRRWGFLRAFRYRDRKRSDR